LVLFTAAFIFYCDRLIKVIRENYANSGNAQSGTMLRAIRRVCLFFFGNTCPEHSRLCVQHR